MRGRINPDTLDRASRCLRLGGVVATLGALVVPVVVIHGCLANDSWGPCATATVDGGCWLSCPSGLTELPNANTSECPGSSYICCGEVKDGGAADAQVHRHPADASVTTD